MPASARQPLRSFDRVAETYDATRTAPAHVATAVTDALLRVLRGTADAPRLLEVGIGTGRIAVPLAVAGVRVTGIDISAKMLEVLRGKCGDIHVVLAEAAQLPFRAASFDAALFVHILHLVPDIEATLRASIRVVSPGGVLIHVFDELEEGGPHLEAGRLLWEVVEASTQAKRPPDVHAEAAATFERVLREHGATVEEQVVMRYQAPFVARKALEHLRRREFSSHWGIPDAAFEDVVERLERRYEQRWGDLDTERPASKTVRLRIARLP